MKLPALDLFAGAGGLSIGLSAAGFDVLAAVERDADACDTFEKHHPRAEVIRGDVGDTDTQARIAEFRGRARVVAGGPPCQPWSTGGKRLGEADERDGFPLFRRALALVGPDAFVMENVAGLLRGRRRTYFDTLIEELGALGYTVTARVLDAADFGAPQRRRRVVTVGLRGATFEFPEPTHGAGRSLPWRAAGTVLSPSAPVGEPNPAVVTYAKNPDWRPCPYDGHVYNGGGRPIDLARPAPTLLASMGGNKTPWVDCAGEVPGYHSHLVAGGRPRAGAVPGARRITVAESALVQTFPVIEVDGSDGVTFCGLRSSQYRQIGNAVPPVLARAVGAALAEQLG
ncbi:MAG: DNA cytosine methyltransferase [Acidimicrobiia bacterium]